MHSEFLAVPARVGSPFEFGVLFNPALVSSPELNPKKVHAQCRQALQHIDQRTATAKDNFLAIYHILGAASRHKDTDTLTRADLLYLRAQTLLRLVNNPSVPFPLVLEGQLLSKEQCAHLVVDLAQCGSNKTFLSKAYMALARTSQSKVITLQGKRLTKIQLLYRAYKMIPENECAQQASTLLMLLKFWKDTILPIDGAVHARQRFVEKLYATSLSPLIQDDMRQNIHYKMYTIWNQTQPFSVFGITVRRHTLEDSAETIRHIMRTGRGASKFFTAPSLPLPEGAHPDCLYGVDSLRDFLARVSLSYDPQNAGSFSLFYDRLF